MVRRSLTLAAPGSSFLLAVRHGFPSGRRRHRAPALMPTVARHSQNHDSAQRPRYWAEPSEGSKEDPKPDFISGRGIRTGPRWCLTVEQILRYKAPAITVRPGVQGNAVGTGGEQVGVLSRFGNSRLLLTAIPGRGRSEMRCVNHNFCPQPLDAALLVRTLTAG